MGIVISRKKYSNVFQIQSQLLKPIQTKFAPSFLKYNTN